MLNILGLETSTEACSVALINAAGEIFSDFKITPRQHTQFLPIMLDSVLQQAGLQRNQITHVSYASGPGAFTGVRIAASTAQGIAIGLGLQLIPISTLAVVAQQALDQHGCEKMKIALDARMGQAYTAIYHKNVESGLVELDGAEQLKDLDQLLPETGLYSIGSGFKARRDTGYIDNDEYPRIEEVYPSAAALVKLAYEAVNRQQTVSPKHAVVNYIRNKVAEKKTNHP